MTGRTIRRITLVAAVVAAAVPGLSIVLAVNPNTAYGSWSCTYNETSGFNSTYVYQAVSGSCAEMYYTSGWYWHSGLGQYYPWGPEEWQYGPGNLYQGQVTTTSQYAYGQIRDFSYMGGTDSPTIEAFAD